jgi:hypothetical protein
MTQDENDYIYVDRLVTQPRRRTRRHLSIADSDWRPAQKRVVECNEMRATITINGVAFDLVVGEVDGDGAFDLRIAGRPYRVGGLLSVGTS